MSDDFDTLDQDIKQAKHNNTDRPQTNHTVNTMTAGETPFEMGELS